MSKLRLVVKGPKTTIYAIELDDETCPAVDASQADTTTAVQFTALFKQHGEKGRIHNERRWRFLEINGTPKVAEWKSNSGWRIYGIWSMKYQAWVLTHGRKKPSDRKVAAEGNRARLIYNRWEDDDNG